MDDVATACTVGSAERREVHLVARGLLINTHHTSRYLTHCCFQELEGCVAAEKANRAEAVAKANRWAAVAAELQQRQKVSGLPSVPLGCHSITHRQAMACLTHSWGPACCHMAACLLLCPQADLHAAACSSHRLHSITCKTCASPYMSNCTHHTVPGYDCVAVLPAEG